MNLNNTRNVGLAGQSRLAGMSSLHGVPSGTRNLYAVGTPSRAKEKPTNRYVVITQSANAPVTPQIRAEKILKEAEVLMYEDASLFHDVVKQLSEKGNSLLGENHPLVRFFSKKRDPDYLKRTDESIAEVRRRSQDING